MKGVDIDQYTESVLDEELDEPHISKSSDTDYIPDPDSYKYNYQPSISTEEEDMPFKYRHVRHGLRSVRPEVYEIAHTLNAEYHMSRRQIEGSFVEISKLFGRNWKAFEPNTTIDNDTLPAMTNMTRTRNYVEAMALNQIVEEIMESDGVAITYSNDGSAMNKVGSYVVQSITVNGIQCALPTISIVTESHESLSDLQVTTLMILSAATGYLYSEAEIFKKITFVMTDSTSHNIGVTEKVCDKLDIPVD